MKRNTGIDINEVSNFDTKKSSYWSVKLELMDKITPTEAADLLQRGLAEWYKPAQTCGRSSLPN
ncbi:MAG: hypothetical protein AB4290_19150 [Spirulina sp.]